MHQPLAQRHSAARPIRSTTPEAEAETQRSRACASRMRVSHLPSAPCGRLVLSTHGCGSKIGTQKTQNETGKWKQKQNLRSPGGLILTHTHMMIKNWIYCIVPFEPGIGKPLEKWLGVEQSSCHFTLRALFNQKLQSVILALKQSSCHFPHHAACMNFPKVSHS